MSPSLQALLAQDTSTIAATLGLDGSTARIEAQCLLQHVLKVSRAWLLAHGERCLNADEQAQYQALLKRRLQGEPIAYILGEREFFGLNLRVTPATLIPRPDTELLVELALERIPKALSRPVGHPLPARSTPEGAPQLHCDPSAVPHAGEGLGEREACHVLDLGTGSGAIALAIAHARPAVSVTAVDASPAALQVAQGNARALALNNVAFVQGHWFGALGGRQFEVIVSNPPYIAAADPHLAQGDVRFEPQSALVSGMDGLDDLRSIVAQASAHLRPGGWLLLEHGYEQAAAVRALLRTAGLAEVFSARDLAGIERVSGGCRHP
ncbi:MAG TPA: peptide chain release factor N(5)-glutamine methyltransferase [Gallionellaceae bacterium]|nr:peptide chain release factor N(5)-glutamine methyltransferase [Gallionellaceae bacterium]